MGRAGLGLARSWGLGWWSGVLLAVVVAVVGCGEQAARTEAPDAASAPTSAGADVELPDVRGRRWRRCCAAGCRTGCC